MKNIRLYEDCVLKVSEIAQCNPGIRRHGFNDSLLYLLSYRSDPLDAFLRDILLSIELHIIIEQDNRNEMTVLIKIDQVKYQILFLEQ